jgi:hypothetical protein
VAVGRGGEFSRAVRQRFGGDPWLASGGQPGRGGGPTSSRGRIVRPTTLGSSHARAARHRRGRLASQPGDPWRGPHCGAFAPPRGLSASRTPVAGIVARPLVLANPVGGAGKPSAAADVCGVPAEIMTPRGNAMPSDHGAGPARFLGYDWAWR